MADSKTADNQLALAEERDKISTELLEKAIQDNSPEFLKELEAISEIGNENLDIELVDIDLIMEQQKANSLKARAIRLLSHFKQLAIRIFYFVKASLILFGKETVPHYLKKFLALLKSGGQSLSLRLGQIRTLSKVQKAVLVLILAGVVGLGFTLVKIATSGLIKDDDQLFVRSMEELSTQKVIYDTGDVEDFYNSPRVSQNIMSVRRIVVNIQKSKTSGSNPMAAIELYIQGNSSDVILEIKDREAELLDRIQGQVRAFSYDEMDTVRGKRRLLDKIIRDLNEDLTKGKITQIYFKNFVLKK